MTEVPEAAAMPYASTPAVRLPRAHIIRSAAAGLLAFLVVSSLLRVALWGPFGLDELDRYTQKIELARSHPSDILFTGASYVDVGIDPDVFDQGMAERGHPVTSFNLGVGGLGVIELQDIIDRILNHQCCKYVLFAPSFHLLNIAIYSNTVRSIRFMNLRHAIDEFYYIFSIPKMPQEHITRTQCLWNVVVAMFRHYTNLGLATTKLSFQPAENWKTDPSWNNRGYTNVHDRVEEKDLPEVFARYIRSRDLYRDKKEQDQFWFADPAMTPGMIDDAVRIGREIEAAGGIPLILIPPKVSYWDWDAEFAAKFIARCGGSHIFDFSDPAAFPELFEPRIRLDDAHMNDLGAHIWSDLLAKRVAALMNSPAPIGPFCAAGEPGSIVKTENK